MKISRLNNVYSPSFSRLLTPVEKIESRVNIDDAKKAIGLEHLVLVTHTPSFPSSKDEDTGIGILSLNKGAKSYIDFAYNNGIDGISIEPMGIVQGEFYSPYDSSVLSKKPIVDLKALTQDEWANILDEEVFEEIVNGKDYNVDIYSQENGEVKYKGKKEFSKDRVIYDYVIKSHRKALESAFENFQAKVKSKDKKALELNAEFLQFKQENDYYLKGDAIYSVLSSIYGEDDFTKWDNKLHQTLLDSEDATFSKEEKSTEIKRLETEYAQDIEFFKFSQFVANKQQREFSDYASKLGQIKYSEDINTVNRALKNGEITLEQAQYLKKRLSDFKSNVKGVNIIGDKQIGYSNMDIWSNPSIFTKDEFMGAPPNPIKGSMAQDWDFNFIPRHKLFNPDGSLAEGGEYLKKITKKAFKDNSGGLRIDHILGTIDPWTYKMTDDNKITSTKLSILLTNALKELKNYGITQDVIGDLKNPLEAIQNPDSEEHAILVKRGVTNFDAINKIISENQDSIDKIRASNACEGSRYMFKQLLNGELSELKELGITEDAINGILDPIRGILEPQSNDRKLLRQSGVKDFEKAKDIVLSKKDAIEKEYAKILEDIILKAGEEVVIERAESLGISLTPDDISKQTRALLICEDLGALTMPLKWVMEKLQLTGMRNALYSNPKDASHIYREINPKEQGHYWLIGTHDSKPYEVEIGKYSQELKEEHVDYISREMGIDKSKIMTNNPFSFIRAKVARIFSADKNPQTPNNVLLNWLDLFASKESYNTPGVRSSELNWNLRVSSSDDSFEKNYYEKTIPSKRGISIPEILSMSLKASGLVKGNEKLNESLKITASIMEE